MSAVGLRSSTLLLDPGGSTNNRALSDSRLDDLKPIAEFYTSHLLLSSGKGDFFTGFGFLLGGARGFFGTSSWMYLS